MGAMAALFAAMLACDRQRLAAHPVQSIQEASQPMAWLYILIAGIFEIAWAVGLKYAQGFTRFWPSAVTVVAMIATYVFLGLGVKTIPIGTGYAVWTGIGVAGTAVLGIVLFGESVAPAKLVCIGLILAGIIGLRLTHGQ